MEKQKTVVKIAGKEYRLVSNESPEYMQRVAAYADRKLRETALTTRLPTPQSDALAALNLADELMKAQDECARLRVENRELNEKLERLRQSQAKPG